MNENISSDGRTMNENISSDGETSESENNKKSISLNPLKKFSLCESKPTFGYHVETHNHPFHPAKHSPDPSLKKYNPQTITLKTLKSRPQPKKAASKSVGETKYPCLYCNKVFTLRGRLVGHTRVHTGEKPYKCQTCAKRFSDSSSLTKHIRTHTGEKPFQCKLCKRAFSISHNLTRHLKLHAKNKSFSRESKHFSRSVQIHANPRPLERRVSKFKVSSHNNPRKVPFNPSSFEIPLENVQIFRDPIKSLLTGVDSKVDNHQTQNKELVSSLLEAPDFKDCQTISKENRELDPDSRAQILSTFRSEHLFQTAPAFKERPALKLDPPEKSNCLVTSSNYVHDSILTFENQLKLNKISSNNSALNSSDAAIFLNFNSNCKKEAPVLVSKDNLNTKELELKVEPIWVDVCDSANNHEIKTESPFLANNQFQTFSSLRRDENSVHANTLDYLKDGHLIGTLESESKQVPMDETRPKQILQVYSCGYCSEKFHNLQLLSEHIQIHKSQKPQMELPKENEENKISSSERGTFAESFQEKDHSKKATTGSTLKDRNILEPSKSEAIQPYVQNSSVFDMGTQQTKTAKQYANKIYLSIDSFDGQQSKNSVPNINKSSYNTPVAPAKMVTNRSNKRFRCTYCCKVFIRHSGLISHLRVHTGEKPYECQTCRKRFSDSSSLTKHIRTHTGEKPFTCRICNRAFSISHNLTRHLKLHSRERQDVANKPSDLFKSIEKRGRSLHCRYCRATFQSLRVLQNHLHYHSVATKMVKAGRKNLLGNIKRKISTAFSPVGMKPSVFFIGNNSSKEIVREDHSQENVLVNRKKPFGSIGRNSKEQTIKNRNYDLSLKDWSPLKRKNIYKEKYLNTFSESPLVSIATSSPSSTALSSDITVSKTPLVSIVTSSPSSTALSSDITVSKTPLVSIATSPPSPSNRINFVSPEVKRITKFNSNLSASLPEHSSFNMADVLAFPGEFLPTTFQDGPSDFSEYEQQEADPELELRNLLKTKIERNLKIDLEASDGNLQDLQSAEINPPAFVDINEIDLNKIDMKPTIRDPKRRSGLNMSLINETNEKSCLEIKIPNEKHSDHRTTEINSTPSVDIDERDLKKKTNLFYQNYSQNCVGEIEKYPKSPLSVCVCGYCQQSFKNLPSLSKHLSSIHKEQQQQIKSKNSVKTNSDVFNLSPSRSQTKKGKKFKFGSKQIKWLRFFQKKENGTNTCPFCSKQFTRTGGLVGHLRVHTGEKPYQCQMCSRKFSDSSSLTKHIRTHTGEKPFRCRLCNRAFSISHNLTRHLKLHSKESQKIASRVQLVKRKADKNNPDANVDLQICRKKFLSGLDRPRSFLMGHQIEDAFEKKSCSDQTNFANLWIDKTAGFTQKLAKQFTENQQNCNKEKPTSCITSDPEKISSCGDFLNVSSTLSFLPSNNDSTSHSFLDEPGVSFRFKPQLSPIPNPNPEPNTLIKTNLLMDSLMLDTDNQINQPVSSYSFPSVSKESSTHSSEIKANPFNHFTSDKTKTIESCHENRPKLSSIKKEAENLTNTSFADTFSKTYWLLKSLSGSVDMSNNVPKPQSFQFENLFTENPDSDSRVRPPSFLHFETGLHTGAQEAFPNQVEPSTKANSLAVSSKGIKTDTHKSDSLRPAYQKDSFCEAPENQTLDPVPKIPYIQSNYQKTILGKPSSIHDTPERSPIPKNTCILCRSCFPNSLLLKSHLKMHRSQNKTFTCGYCNRSFVRFSGLMGHARTHTLERPYVCRICQRAFSDSSSLTKHNRIHTGEKPFTCKYCSRAFSISHNLTRHLKKLHLKEENKPP